ncbi:single-stranded DNA-binding protein, partial [Leptospira interrogans]|uniref:single-stranded DNA-binding protein n=1 Tax=Leptospira interrogans TaxID=173 RepID=UPI0040352981
MTAHIAAHGRLVVDVQSKSISNGNLMSFARMAVALPCQKAEGGESTLWLAVTSFGRPAELLAKHMKGEIISVSGNLQVSQWVDGKGQTQSGLQLIADSVISARTVRSGGNRK